jgi:mono/diheme cytochrome c family protein
MPTYFEGSDSGPDEILGGDETKQIVAIVEYVLSLRSSPEKLSAYAAAKKRHPGATRAWGARLMGDLNCAGCHDVGGMHERLEAGPPLAHEGSRVRKKWLVEFLKNPSQIRPIGYAEGRSSRMPNFRLTSDEAETLAEYLISLKDKRTHGHEKPHSVQKAQAKRGARLFASLRCKTCHQIKDDLDKSPPSGFGGPSLAHAAEHVINDQPERGVSSGFRGPNLTHAGRRLKENHLRLWFMGDVTRSGSKLEMDAHPLVPAMGLTRKQIEELSAYVVTLK